MLTTVIMCLALNIYFEARNQPIDGQIAVTHVVLNRAVATEYPDNICDVVYQAELTESGDIIKRKCQFSWYCDGKSDIPKDLDALRWANYIAINVLYGVWGDPTGGATHYHSKDVSPAWADEKEKTAVIGEHIFFKSLTEL